MSGGLKEHDKGLEVSRNKGEGKAYDNICQEEYHDTWFLTGHPSKYVGSLSIERV